MVGQPPIKQRSGVGSGIDPGATVWQRCNQRATTVNLRGHFTRLVVMLHSFRGGVARCPLSRGEGAR